MSTVVVEVRDVEPTPGPEHGAGDPRTRRITIGVVLALLAVGATLFLGLDWHRGSDSAETGPVSRSDALAAARTAAVALTTLDASAPEESLTRWEDVTTGALHDAVGAGDAAFQKLITTGDVDTASSVQDAAVASVDEEARSARVLVAVDVTLTPRRGKESLQRLGLAVTVVETGDGWKASALQAVGTTANDETGVTEHADVTGDVAAAMTELWSYDYRALSGVGSLEPITTDSFRKEYAQVYRRIEELAPATGAVVTAEVTGIAAIAVEDDRALLLVFLDQRAKKSGGERSTAEARLRVEAELVDGTWRVAGVEPF